MPLKDDSCTKIVVNGVFHLLGDYDEVEKSLDEIYRVSRNGALIFIGNLRGSYNIEKPAKHTRKNLNWLISRIKEKGIINICSSLYFERAKKIFYGDLRKIKSTAGVLAFKKEKFLKMCEDHGLKVLNVKRGFDKNYLEFDYICTKDI